MNDEHQQATLAPSIEEQRDYYRRQISIVTGQLEELLAVKVIEGLADKKT